MYNVSKRTQARKVNTQISNATTRMINGKSGGNLPSVAEAKKAVEMMDRKAKRNAPR